MSPRVPERGRWSDRALLPLVLVLLLTLVVGPWSGPTPAVAAVEDAVARTLTRCARPALLPALAVTRNPGATSGRTGSAAVVAAVGREQRVPARAQALAVAAALAGDLRPAAAVPFYRRLTRAEDWASLPPSIALHRILGTPDPFAYERTWPLAAALLTDLTGRPVGQVARALASGGRAPQVCVGSSASRRAVPLPPGSAYAVAEPPRRSRDDLLLTAPCGTPVLAATPGTVGVRTDDPEGGPWVVTVTSVRGTTSYAHLQEPVVDDGSVVAAGEQLAQVGDLGAVEQCALGLRVEDARGQDRGTASAARWLVPRPAPDAATTKLPDFGATGGFGDLDLDDLPTLEDLEDLEDLAEEVETAPPPAGVPAPGGDTEQQPDARTTPTVRTTFRAASFNVLGAHLTAPGGGRPGFGPGPQRMAQGLAKLEAAGVSIVVLNEFETPAASVVVADGDWQLHRATPNNVFRGGNTNGNGIAWRPDTWNAVDTSEFTVPWKVTLHMPVVTLQHRVTGAQVTVIGVHNPATTRRAGNQAPARATARRIELAQVAALRRTDPTTPVLLAGDFNERDEVYCAFLGSGLLQTSARGGPAGARCRAPSHTVDWIFGTRDLVFGGEVVDRSTLGTISDHPLLTAAVTLPSQRR